MTGGYIHESDLSAVLDKIRHNAGGHGNRELCSDKAHDMLLRKGPLDIESPLGSKARKTHEARGAYGLGCFGQGISAYYWLIPLIPLFPPSFLEKPLGTRGFGYFPGRRRPCKLGKYHLEPPRVKHPDSAVGVLRGRWFAARVASARQVLYEEYMAPEERKELLDNDQAGQPPWLMQKGVSHLGISQLLDQYGVVKLGQ